MAPGARELCRWRLVSSSVHEFSVAPLDRTLGKSRPPAAPMFAPYYCCWSQFPPSLMTGTAPLIFVFFSLRWCAAPCCAVCCSSRVVPWPGCRHPWFGLAFGRAVRLQGNLGHARRPQGARAHRRHVEGGSNVQPQRLRQRAAAGKT